MASKKLKPLIRLNEYIVINALCPDNSYFYYINQKKTDTFQHFMEKFSEETGIDMFDANFLLNGKRVLSSDTPNSIGLKTGDILRCNIVCAYDVHEVDHRPG